MTYTLKEAKMIGATKDNGATITITYVATAQITGETYGFTKSVGGKFTIAKTQTATQIETTMNTEATSLITSKFPNI